MSCRILFGPSDNPAAHADRLARLCFADAQHVAPILDAHCVTCHRSGEIGPFSMVDYGEAKKRAKQIASVAGERTMPPWKPDAGHGEFLDERKLTTEQIATLKAWADAGAPEGDSKLRPKPPVFKTGWKLGKPDLVLKMPEAFKIPAKGHDIYHHFVFPMNLKKDTHLIGIECRPGNPKVAHHAVGIRSNWIPIAAAQSLDDLFQRRPFLIRQPDDILLHHGRPSSG